MGFLDSNIASIVEHILWMPHMPRMVSYYGYACLLDCLVS